MATQNRTLNDLTIDELKGVKHDLQLGVRYNEVKAKYNLASNAVNADTIGICSKLIFEKTPVEPEPEKKDIARLSNTTSELQKELYNCGGKVDSEGRFYW